MHIHNCIVIATVQWLDGITNSMDVSLGNFETPYTMDGRREEDGQIDKQMDG